MAVSPTTAEVSAGPRLRAAFLAIWAVMVIVVVGIVFMDNVVHKRLRELLVNPLAVKDQGVWLQKQAFALSETLSLYGSSELTEKQENRADSVFSTLPTDFEVCPVGAPGHTTLLMAAKLGALEDSAKGRKVAVILSPSWFRRAGALPDQVAGCLSPLQAYRYLRNARLDESLRRRFAERLLAYPDALKSQPVLEVALKDCVHGGMWRWALAPFAALCEMDLKWEDHLAVGCAAVFEPPKMPPSAGLPVSHGKIPWRALVDEKEKAQAAEGEPEIRKIHSLETPEDKEAEYIASYEGGKEWDDLKLLLDTMKALQMKPLIIGVPLGGNGLEAHGVSRAAREHYYQHLRDVCAPYGWPLVDFAEHDMDPGFLIKGTSHYTAKGWLYVNWTLDDFYHERPIKSGVVH